jgi:hypothetical protein
MFIADAFDAMGAESVFEQGRALQRFTAMILLSGIRSSCNRHWQAS